MTLARAFRRVIAVESFTVDRQPPAAAPPAPAAGGRWGRPSAFEVGSGLRAPPPPATTVVYERLHEVRRYRGVESHRAYALSAAAEGQVTPEAIRSVTFYMGEREVRHERVEAHGRVTNVTPVIETIRDYVRFDFPFERGGARGVPHPPPTPPRKEPA